MRSLAFNTVQDVAPGAWESAPQQAPFPVRQVAVRLSRLDWPHPGREVLAWTIQSSLDGVQWKELGSARAAGGRLASSVSGQVIRMAQPLPLGSWVKVALQVDVPLTTRVVLLWQ